MLGMVFAAGLGTRLRPLTEELPKPVVPLVNRPLAAFSLERLAAAGVTHCVVNTHHLADEVVGALEGLRFEGMDVMFVHEPTLLGTGGGLKNGLTRLISEVGIEPYTPILVMNGDIFFWPDLEGALAVHRELDAIATMVLRPDPRAAKLGAVEVDASMQVRRLLGKPEAVDAPLAQQMFTGVHVLSIRAIEGLPDEGCVIRSAYRHWVDDPATRVGGFVDLGEWRDLGTPNELLRANLDLLSGDLRWPSFVPPSDGVLKGEKVEVGQGAQLSEVVLGDGAKVAAGARLERVVVWPGASVSGDVSDAIVAAHGTVRVDAS